MRTSRDALTAQESSLKRRRTVFDSDSDQEEVTHDIIARLAPVSSLSAVSSSQFPAKAEAASQSASFATHHEYKDGKPRDLSITNENMSRNTVSVGLPYVDGNTFDHNHHKDATLNVHSDLTSRPSAIADPTQTSHSRVGGLDRAPADRPVAAPSRGSLKADLVSLLLDTLQAEVEQYMFSTSALSNSLVDAATGLYPTASALTLPPFTPRLGLSDLAHGSPRLAQWLCTATPSRLALTLTSVTVELAQMALGALASFSCSPRSCQGQCLPSIAAPTPGCPFNPGWCRYAGRYALHAFARGHVLIQPVVIGYYDNISHIDPSLSPRSNATAPSHNPALAPIHAHARGMLANSPVAVPTARSLGALVPFVAYLTDVFPPVQRTKELPLIPIPTFEGAIGGNTTRGPARDPASHRHAGPMGTNDVSQRRSVSEFPDIFNESDAASSHANDGSSRISVESPYQFAFALLGADPRTSQRPCVIYSDAPHLNVLSVNSLVRGTAYVTLDAPEPLPSPGGASQPSLVLWLTHVEPTAVELLHAPLYLGPEALCPPAPDFFMSCDLSVYSHLIRLATDFGASVIGPATAAVPGVLVKTRLALMLSLVSAQPEQVIEQTQRSIAAGHLPPELIPYCNPRLNLLHVCIANIDEDPCLTRLLAYSSKFHPRSTHVANPTTKLWPLLGEQEGIVAITLHNTTENDVKSITSLLGRIPERSNSDDRGFFEESRRTAYALPTSAQAGRRQPARAPSLLAIEPNNGRKAQQCVWIEHKGDAWMSLAHITTRPRLSVAALEARMHWILNTPAEDDERSTDHFTEDSATTAARGDPSSRGVEASAWEQAWLGGEESHHHNTQTATYEEEKEWRNVFASARMLSVLLSADASEFLARYTTAARRIGRLTQREMATITTIALNCARLQLKSQAGIAEVLIGLLFVEESQAALTLALSKAPENAATASSFNLHLPYVENDAFSVDSKYRHATATARFKQFYLDVLVFIRNAENTVLSVQEDMFAPF